MKKKEVFIIKTSPEKVIANYQRLIGFYKKLLNPKKPVVLKPNLSWTKFYPACSSPPWQVEGVIKALIKLGWKPENIIPVENKTVVTDVRERAKNHHWIKILKIQTKNENACLE
jgi:hypothetical protein